MEYHHLINSQVPLFCHGSPRGGGGNEYGKSGHLSMFTKHLMMLLKYKFFRASFLHLIIKGHAPQFFVVVKVEILLNYAFKQWL